LTDTANITCHARNRSAPAVSDGLCAESRSKLEFYLDLLGFQIVFERTLATWKTGQPWVVVSPPDGTANLTLIVPRTDSEQFKQIGRASHVTFVTEDVLAKFANGASGGVHFLSNPRLRRFKHACN